jgi:hypothetical protein
MPPPMSLHRLQSPQEHSFTAVAFGESGNLLTGMTNGAHVHVFRIEIPARGGPETLHDPQLITSLSFSGTAVANGLRQLVCLSPNSFLSILGSETLVELSWAVSSPEAQPSIRLVRLEKPILRIRDWPGFPGSALVELSEGVVLRYQDGEVSPCDDRLLEPCPWVAPLGSHAVVGLSSRGRLYLGDHLLCSGVSTFLVSKWQDLLMYVTTGSRPELRCLSVSELLRRRDDPMRDPEAEAGDSGLGTVLEPRALERGALLVAALHGAPTVVVQVKPSRYVTRWLRPD